MTASMSGTSISKPTLVGFCGSTNVRMFVTPRPEELLTLGRGEPVVLVLDVVVANNGRHCPPSDQVAARLGFGQPMPPRLDVPNEREAGRLREYGMSPDAAAGSFVVVVGGAVTYCGAPGGPVGLDRYALRVGSRVDQV